MVHRLLQRLGFDEPPPLETIRDAASRLLRAAEIDDGGDIAALIEMSAVTYSAMCGREDVREIYTATRKFHEVPFSMTLDGRILRGTVDCLAETSPGHLSVIEFKTGRPRPEHARQVELYRRAMEHIFPDFSIDARLVYARRPPGA